ncbi:MAG: oligosaccharide flippase family protein, partial [Candidatus Krumholzibacteria bacterium]|nr:oligosaccharide flippase family protein [Candidatus Krumholzibacteria bacterium]
GFNTSIVKLIPEYLQKGREDMAAMIYNAAVLLTLVLSTFWCVLLIVFAPWIAENIAHQPEAAGPIRIYALIIPFLALNAFFAVAYLAVQRGKLRAAITIAHGLLNVALPIAAVLWRRDVVAVIAGFLTAEVIGALLFTVYFHRKAIRHWTSGSGPLVRGIREIFGFGFLFFFASLGWNLINTVDRIMVKYYLPAEQLGFYAMAAIVITAMSIISSTAGTALIPSLTATRVSGDMQTFRRQIRSTARIALMALLPIVMMIWSLAGDAISIVLPKFLPSAGIVKILVFVGIADIFCRTAWASLAAYGKGGLSASAYLASALLNIALNMVLIPRMGIAGAAVATLTTFIILAAILQAMMWSVTKTRISPLYAIHPALLASVYPLLSLASGSLPHWARIIIVVAAGSALYKILAALTGLIRKSDLATASAALGPRSHVPHVRFALKGISLLEKITRR